MLELHATQLNIETTETCLKFVADQIISNHWIFQSWILWTLWIPLRLFLSCICLAEILILVPNLLTEIAIQRGQVCSPGTQQLKKAKGTTPNLKVMTVMLLIVSNTSWNSELFRSKTDQQSYVCLSFAAPQLCSLAVPPLHLQQYPTLNPERIWKAIYAYKDKETLV